MMSQNTDRARVVTRADWGEELNVLVGPGSCREVVGPRIGTSLRSLYALSLKASSASIALKHPTEAVYYVIDGNVTVESSVSSTISLTVGGMFHVTPGTDYRIVASSDSQLIGGPSPVDPLFGTPAAQVDSFDSQLHEITAFHRDEPGMMVPFISNDARLIVWYGAGAVQANMNYVVMEPGERNKEHVHDYSEDTIYILEGHGTAEDVTNGVKLPFGPGDVLSIPPGVYHAVAADRGERVVSVGGPCPADLDMLRAVGVDVDAIAKERGSA